MLRRPGPPLALALLGLLALVATGVLAKLVHTTEVQDSRSLQGFVDLNRPSVTPWASHIAHLVDPGRYALIGLALTAVALVRRRWRIAATVPVLFVSTGVITALLKHGLASPRLNEWVQYHGRSIADSSWPSGHSTAAMTVALCAVIVAPPRLRPTVAALGACFAIAVGYSILTLSWHFPSDVFGGYLVAGTSVLLAVALLAAAEQRWPAHVRVDAQPRAVDVVPALALIGGAVAVAAGAALARPRAAVDYAQAHTTFVAVAAAIAVLGVLLASVVGLGLRGGPRAPA